MCYLVREHAAAAGQEQPGKPGRPQLPPRWAGVLGATLVGGLALAALLVPASLPPEANVQQLVPSAPVAASLSVGPLTPVAASMGAGPVTPVGGQQTPMVDDGVPSSTDVAKAGLGGCHHGM